MAYRIAKEKIKAIATEYIANGFKPVEALVVGGGYNRKYAMNYHKKIWTNVELLAEIDRLQAKTAIKAEISRDDVINDLIAIKQSSTSSANDKIRALSLISDVCGFKRENAPNKEREALLRKVESMEATELREYIKHRNDRLGKGLVNG